MHFLSCNTLSSTPTRLPLSTREDMRSEGTITGLCKHNNSLQIHAGIQSSTGILLVLNNGLNCRGEDFGRALQ